MCPYFIVADVPPVFYVVVCIIQGRFVILTWFGVTDGTRLKNEKLNTAFVSLDIRMSLERSDKTKKAIYECTGLKYVETKCL